MKNNYYAVIMAGGVGSRFWPLSTKENPKQFHDMLGTGNSLIQQTFKRLEKSIPNQNILIATNAKYQNLVLKQLPQVSEKQVLLEPAMRNTAPCILYSALKIYKENPEAIMVVAPSDHWIENEAEFLNNLDTAFQFCQENDALVTLGIKPNSPNTGYGYIKYEASKNTIKKVEKFTEKPNLEKAQQFLNEGNYLWNAGIFVWSVSSILKAFELQLPEMYHLFRLGDSHYGTTSEKEFIAINYEKSQNISIDFGVMENAQNVFVLPVDFGWNDLGTWGSLYQKLPKDTEGNATVNAEAIFNNAKNNIVRTQKGKKIVIQGLSNYIVVEKEDVILICPKSDEQNIKEITNEVENTFGNKFV